MNKKLLKRCKYRVDKIEDLNGNPKTDEGAKRRLGKYGTAIVVSDTMIFIYGGNLNGFRTSKIQNITPSEKGVVVTTLNTKYCLEEVKNNEKDRR